MEVYRHEIVEEIENFYGDLLFRRKDFPSIYDHLHTIAYRLWEGVQAKFLPIYTEINNYHPAYLGVTPHQLTEIPIDLEDCKTTIAHEYGFGSWSDLEIQTRMPYDQTFESAVDHLLAGNIAALRDQLAQEPALIEQTSAYGHRATLLHYTASNGVEIWRQKVPANLPEITKLLLDNGADRRAAMLVYGGKFDTLALLSTSAHPFQAGVGEKMKIVLSNL